MLLQKKRIIFGIGSNLGDREFYLNQAVLELENQLLLKSSKRSEIFKNPAMLMPNSPAEWDQEFFNIAFSAEIDLEKFPPQKILETVKIIEKKLGRVEGQRWSPREIDIDILAIEGVSVKTEGLLEIPHPGLFERDFFLKTAKEIEPDFFRKIADKNCE